MIPYRWMSPTPAEPRSASPPVVVSIVVSFNSAAHLPACLTSLERQHDIRNEIHVVDNASSDGSADFVRRDHPNVHLIVNPVNAGFARANNQVLESVPAEFYALVNPDAVLPDGALAACVDYLRSETNVGMVATRLVGADGALQRSCHSFLSLTNLFGETLGLHRALPGLRPLTSYHLPWFHHDRIADVDWIQGAFLVLRAEVVLRVGAFDSEFYMYGEEMDWCRRIRDAGWRVIFLPGPEVLHVGGGSSDLIAGPMFVESLKARVRYLRKHRGRSAVAMARGLIALSVIVRFLAAETRWSWNRLAGRRGGDRLHLHRDRFRSGIRWVLRGLPMGST